MNKYYFEVKKAIERIELDIKKRAEILKALEKVQAKYLSLKKEDIFLYYKIIDILSYKTFYNFVTVADIKNYFNQKTNKKISSQKIKALLEKAILNGDAKKEIVTENNKQYYIYFRKEEKNKKEGSIK